jgi:feruloyl esterase
MLAAVAQGYTAVATNGGWTSNNPRGFALLRPGEVDIKSLKHFASTSLNDLSIIGKSVIKSFYGQPARYSYGNGCSQGGRQGFMLAQQYPRAFSGIAASSSAIRWASLMPAGFWAQALMHDMGKYPNPCEVSTLSAAAMKACDGNDGVMDGLISDPDSCHFDPYTLVNTTTSCFGTKNIKISKEAAYLAHTAWTGMKASNQSFLHDGNTYEAAIVTAGAPLLDSVFTRLNITIGLADRQCNANGTCIGRPLDLVDDWIRYFIVKDPNYDSSKMTMKEFNAIFETSKREYTDIIGTGATDLSGFRKVGGKLLSYHGLVSPSPYQSMSGDDN